MVILDIGSVGLAWSGRSEIRSTRLIGDTCPTDQTWFTRIRDISRDKLLWTPVDESAETQIFAVRNFGVTRLLQRWEMLV